MRTIKFRGWDKQYKKMIQPHDGDFIKWHAMSNWKDCIEVMQYTGLKDKNGKEIYEGDIVKITHVWRGRVHEGEVFMDKYSWNVKGFYFTHYDSPSDAFSEGTNTNNVAFEVIGNIYENPDLI